MQILPRLAALLVATCAATTASAGPSIRVQPGDWGGASLEDIQAVAASVAGVLLPDFPQHASARIDVAFSAAGPRVLAEKSADGAHQVLLNVRGTRWDQLAYQFSHELCHIVSNYDRREIGAARPHQWFEETLCEAVSIVALRRLASSWNVSPPYAAWKDYAPAFERYALRLAGAEHRRLTDAVSVAAWYRDNAGALEANPYLRDRNELAASALLQLFESIPGSLQAVGYLNLGAPSEAGLAGYLASWRECCPEAHRAFVLRLMSLFAAT